jgi:hypothetical protein
MQIFAHHIVILDIRIKIVNHINTFQGMIRQIDLG